MAQRVYDDFNRPDGPLGVATTGQAWRHRAGASTSVIRSREALVYLGALETVEAGLGGGDGLLSVVLGGTASGAGAAFRVAGPGDYWALSQRVFTETYESGTETYQSGTETYISSYGTYPTEYEWVKTFDYYNYVSHNYSDTYSNHAAYAWSTDPNNNPWGISSGTYYSSAHNHYLEGAYYPGDQYPHAHTAYASRTGATRGGGTYPIYSTRPVYSTRAVYSTRLVYMVRLELIVGGAVSGTPWEAGRSLTPRSGLEVFFEGSAIAVREGGVDLIAVTSATHAGASAHGIVGRSTEGTLGTITRFTFTPTRSGLYTPTMIV